jgi:hypothetical protein
MSSVIISGDTSGAITLSAPAVSGTNTLTLPAVTGNILTNKSAGTVLQVLSTSKLDAFTTTSTSAIDVTGLSVSITPTSSSSKILILAQVFGGGAAGTALYVNLVRNSTNLSISTVSSASLNSTVGAFVGSSTVYTTSPIMFLDSPATTSSTTYKIQIFGSDGSQIAINRRSADAVVGGTSSITVMEVAA